MMTGRVPLALLPSPLASISVLFMPSHWSPRVTELLHQVLLCSPFMVQGGPSASSSGSNKQQHQQASKREMGENHKSAQVARLLPECDGWCMSGI